MDWAGRAGAGAGVAPDEALIGTPLPVVVWAVAGRFQARAVVIRMATGTLRRSRWVMGKTSWVGLNTRPV